MSPKLVLTIPGLVVGLALMAQETPPTMIAPPTPAAVLQTPTVTQGEELPPGTPPVVPTEPVRPPAEVTEEPPQSQGVAQSPVAERVGVIVKDQNARFPNDVLGWQGVRWGMTAEQVTAALPDAAPIKHSYQAGKRPGEAALLRVEKFRIGEVDFKVQLYFSAARPRSLTSVVLAFSSEFQAHKADYDGMKSALIQKYGPPSTAKELENESAGNIVLYNKNTVWVFPSSTITLSQTKGTGLLAPRTTLVLVYQATSVTGGVADRL